MSAGAEGAASAGAEGAGGPRSEPRRWAQGAWVASTYFAEGLPYTIAHKVASELFTAAGASLRTIGLLSWLGLPWNLKFLWSPLIDVLGGARAWLVAVELALTVALFGLAWTTDRGSFGLVLAALALVAMAGATHDIAVDGFYLQALDKDRQAAFTGLRVAAYRVALLCGGFLVSLAGRTSWRASFLVAGIAFALLAGLHARWLPAARKRPAAEAPGRVDRRRFVEAFLSFMRQPRIVPILAFIILYRAGDALMFAMSSPLLKDLGLGTAARGDLAMAGMVPSIAGSMLGGEIIARRGLSRAIFPIASLQSLAILLYVALAWSRPGTAGVVVLVLLEQLAAGIGTAVLAVFLMRRCMEPYKASHFAIGSALMSGAATFGGSVSGYIAEQVGFTAFFLIAFAASIPGVVLSRLVPTE